MVKFCIRLGVGNPVPKKFKFILLSFDTCTAYALHGSPLPHNIHVSKPTHTPTTYTFATFILVTHQPYTAPGTCTGRPRRLPRGRGAPCWLPG